MKQITEDYCSFEISKLLKEKGFDGRMHTFYTDDGTEIESSYVVSGNFITIYRPTHQMALKWLREVHKIIVEINMEDYITEVDGKLTITYSYTIWHFNRHLNDIGETDIRYTDEAIWDKDSHNSYEEAVEASLLYVLKNLI